jgi:hypothetical protein
VTAVIDDALALACLLGAPPAELVALGDGEPNTTTGAWYFRLCRALLQDSGGNLSGRVSKLSERGRDVVLRRVWTPPPEVLRVLGLAEVAPGAAALAVQHGLNLVSAEALAVALALDAPIFVEACNNGPRLEAAASDIGVDYRIVS